MTGPNGTADATAHGTNSTAIPVDTIATIGAAATLAVLFFGLDRPW